ncbi:MAG: hypothetical protein SGJ02_01660 [bacterium]|nr:hypothetical protein [bacterium]
MAAVGENEIWNLIPPEEKLELLAESQASGLYSCFMMIAVFFTLAIALKLKFLIWISLLASPLMFQTAAHRKWRDMKPKIMLKYLAARSVARRFAYAGNAQGLDLEILFRGSVMDVTNESNIDVAEALQSIEFQNRNNVAWIGLLSDAIVAFSESRQGGVLEFVSIADKRIEVEGQNSDGSRDDYSNSREVFLTITKPFGGKSKFKISSEYPVALNAFEKKLKSRVDASKRAYELIMSEEAFAKVVEQ